MTELIYAVYVIHRETLEGLAHKAVRGDQAARSAWELCSRLIDAAQRGVDMDCFGCGCELVDIEAIDAMVPIVPFAAGEGVHGICAPLCAACGQAQWSDDHLMGLLRNYLPNLRAVTANVGHKAGHA